MIRGAAERAGVDAGAAERLLDAFFDELLERMMTEDMVPLRPDVGRFLMRTGGAEQRGGTGNMSKLRRTPAFKRSRALEKHLRQSKEEYVSMLRAMGREEQARRVEKSSWREVGP